MGNICTLFQAITQNVDLWAKVRKPPWLALIRIYNHSTGNSERLSPISASNCVRSNAYVVHLHVHVQACVLNEVTNILFPPIYTKYFIIIRMSDYRQLLLLCVKALSTFDHALSGVDNHLDSFLQLPQCKVNPACSCICIEYIHFLQ